MTDAVEHPFAPFIRTLGKGKHGSRALSTDEAYSAMKMILTDQVEPMQLGAFLMLMRVKEETPAELAGFVRAARETFTYPANMPEVDIDWSSYAGKRRHLPWFLLSTLMMANAGIKVFMHGIGGRKDDRAYTPETLAALGIKPCADLAEAAKRIEETNFAFVPLKNFSPKLAEFIELRPLLGLRSPVHTLSRLLNPFNAKVMMQGIFHPGYQETHQGAGVLLKQPYLAVLKGDGGEIERDPDIPCLVKVAKNGETFEEEWPAMFPEGQRHLKEELDISKLAKVWRGEMRDEYGEAAVIGTAAIALKGLGRAETFDGALALAREMWEKRDTGWLKAA